MNKGRYRIGEVSRITGVSKDTLHFYSKIGLLTPDYIDENNQYRYYSRWNLWQLDIINTCRKLNIPLEKIRQILSMHDNSKIVELLLEYRDVALQLSAYYQQVADDILWYGQENQHIQSEAESKEVKKIWLDAETVIAGVLKRDEVSYHANLQEAAKDDFWKAPTIRRKYGYIIDVDRIGEGEFIKKRSYMKIADKNYQYINTDNLYTIPAGNYAVFVVHIKEGHADFSFFLHWLEENGFIVDEIFAEELGLQLFDYIDDYYCQIKAHLI